MRKYHIVSVVALLLLISNIAIFIPPDGLSPLGYASAGVPPAIEDTTTYWDDDWIVNSSATYRNQTIIVNGNLIVTEGSALTLINMTIKMNGTGNLSRYIQVNNTGSLIIQDYDGDPLTYEDGCNITSNHTDGKHRFGFNLTFGSNFLMVNSNLSECGHSGASLSENGLYIRTDSAVVKNCSISNCNNGVIIYSSSGVIIENTTISNVRAFGFYIISSSDSYIHNNTVTTTNNNSDGIWLTGTSLRNRFVGNTITCMGSSTYCLFLSSFSSQSEVISNTFNCTNADSRGIYVQSSSTNITSNTIFCWLNAYQCIDIDSVSWVNLTDNILFGNDTMFPLAIDDSKYITVRGGSIIGISSRNYLTDSHNITFDSVRLRSIGTLEAIGISNVTDVLIINSTIIPDDEDLVLYNGAQVTVRNTPTTKIGFFDALSNLTVQYFLNVTIKNSKGDPVPGTNVQIKNKTGVIVFNGPPDANGTISYIPLTGAIHNKTTSIFHTPHNITVTAPSYVNWYTDPIMDQSKSLFATLLKPGEKPTIHYTSDWNVVGFEEYWNETFLMDGNITVYNGGILILHNCSVFMNCSQFDGQYHVEVRTGGVLRVLDYDWDNSTTGDESLITDSPFDIDDGSILDFAFNFTTNWGGHLEVRNSSIRDCGWLPNPAQPWLNLWDQGVWIDADNAILDHVNITNRHKGIIISWTSDVVVSNCTININASEIEAIGILTYDSSRTHILNNCITMSGTGTNQTGISLNNNIDNMILGNYINMRSANGWGDGISIVNGGSGNWVFANTVDQNVDGSGIILWDTDSATVAYNDVQTHASYSSAIQLGGGGATNSIIQHNNVILYGLGRGFNIQDDCQNTRVNNNTIVGAGDYIEAISVDNAYNNFTVSNNIINLTGMYSTGLWCDQSSYFDVYGLNVTISDMYSSGLSLFNCDNLSIGGVNISTSSGADDSFGAWVEHSENIVIVDFNANLQNDGGTGLWLHDGASNCFVINADISTIGVANEALVGFNCSSIVILNSTLSASAQDDIVLTSGATIAIINTTHSDRTIADPFSSLYVFWYLHVKVIDDLGQPINGVNVRVQRADAIDVYNGITDNNGWVKWMLCLGYMNSSTSKNNSSNPYLINASNASCWDELTVDLTDSGRTVTLTQSNDNPIITNPVSNIIIREDSIRTWDFNATDHENNPFVWSINTTSRWIRLNRSTGKLTIAPNETHVGIHYFKIRVIDINSGYDEFDIRLTITNRAPVIQTVNVLTAVEDALYIVDYASDDDPGTTWSLVNEPSWLSINSNTGVLSGTPNNAHVGDWYVNISLEDGHDSVIWNNFTLTVQNNPPTIITSDLLSATEDQLYLVDYASTDDDQGSITWSMVTGPSWLLIDQSTGELLGTPTNAHVKRWTVTIEVNDGNSGLDQRTFSLTVKNMPPMILTKDVTWVDEDSLYEVDYSSSDDGFGIIVWSLDSNADGWLKIDSSTGLLSGTPKNEHVGSYNVNVTVRDDHNGISWHNFTLAVNNTNDAPVIITKDVLDASEDQLYLVKYKASDDDGDTVTWSLTTNTKWLKMDSKSGELSGTPTNLDVGIYEVTISCNDGNLGIASKTFNLTVLNINDPPIIDDYLPTETYPTVEEGKSLDFNISYSDEDSDTFTIVWTLDGNDMRFDVPFWSYIPDFSSAGDHEVIVNITDSGGASVSQRWIVIVSFANRAPLIDDFKPTNLKPILDPSTSTMSFSINAMDPDSDQMTYEWLINGEDTGERESTFVFDRLRLTNGPGTYNLTVRVIDSEGSLTDHTWTVDIKPESSKKETSGNFIPILVALVVAIIVIIIILFIIIKKKQSKIEDIFIISDSGLLLAHKSKELRPDIDDNILSGMLTAIQDFVKDAFKDKSKFGLRRLDFGDSEIRLKRGKGFYLAVVVSGEKVPANLEDKLDKTIAKIEAIYGKALEKWKGNLDEMRGIKDQLDVLMK